MQGKGNRFIFLYHVDRFSATKGCFVTPLARLSITVVMSNQHNSQESCHGENENKAGNGRKVQSRPGAREKRGSNDSICPYQELRKVP